MADLTIAPDLPTEPTPPPLSPDERRHNILGLLLVGCLVLLPAVVSAVISVVSLLGADGGPFVRPSTDGLFSPLSLVKLILSRLQWFAPLFIFVLITKEGFVRYGLQKPSAKKTASDSLILLGLIVAAMVVLAVVMALLAKLTGGDLGLPKLGPSLSGNSLGALSIGLIVVFLPLNSIVEEFVFRSFLFEKLNYFIGNKFICVLICSVFFGIGHFFQGFFAVIVITIMALIFGLYFAAKRNLWPPIIIHTLKNAVAIIVGLTSLS